MNKREFDLLLAAAGAAGVMRGLLDNTLGDHGGLTVARNTLRELDRAIAAYDPPPITSEPGFDARDNSSLGMKEDFGMGEVRS